MDGASVATCSLNLVLATVGVGALTLPYELASVGWAQAAVMLAVFTLLSVYNLILLDRVCRQLPSSSDTSTYASVVASVLGTRGAYALEAAMLLYCFGLTVSYLGVIGTEGAAAAANLLDWHLPTRICVALAAAVVVLPLAVLPEWLLQHAGTVGTLCMIFTTCVVVSQVPWSSGSSGFVDTCARSSQVGAQPVAWVWSWSAVLSATPIFTFCMFASSAFVSVRARLPPEAADGPLLRWQDEDYANGGSRQPLVATGQPSVAKVLAVIWIGQLVAVVDYIAAGFAGYFTFCKAVPENVLDGYALGNGLALAARLALAAQLTLACSGVYMPLARAALWHLLFGLDRAAPEGVPRVGATLGLLAGALGAALALDGALELPLGLTSSVCSTAMMFIFPGICAYKLAASARSTRARLGPALFFVVGLLIGVASTIMLLTQV